MSEVSAPKLGRPSVYTPELAAEICDRLSDGQTLREICRDDHMPTEAAVRQWAIADREGFSSQYDAARLKGYARMADELIEIADDGTNDWVERQNKDGSTYTAVDSEHIQRSRLRVDTRKWLLSKALPKVYGDKVTQEIQGPDGGPVPIALVELRPVAAKPDESGS